MSKISAALSNKQLDDHSDIEKESRDKIGTNLLLNNQLEQNMASASASINFANRNNKESKQRKGNTHVTTAQLSPSNPVYFLNQDDHDSKTQENENNTNDNNIKKSSTATVNSENSSNNRLIKAGNKILSVVQANLQTNGQQPIHQAKSSAFSLSYSIDGKDTQSSNENIDNGYYTMTHTTPYHHLMEEDHVPVNGHKKDGGKKNDNKMKSENEAHQKNFSKVYKEESKKLKKNSEKGNESQSEESKEDEANNNEKQQENSSGKTKARTEQQMIVRKADEMRNKNTLPTRRDIEKKNFMNIKQNQRNLPVAKAYEGK